MQDRGIFLEADEDSGKIYFEVERHNAILGAVYRPGCAMAAFVTRWIKYSFDGQTIDEIDDNRPPFVDIDKIDFDALAEDLTDSMSFSMDEDEHGQYWISELCCNGAKTIVTSIEDVRAYGRSIAEEWSFDSMADTIDAPISEEEIHIIIKKITSAFVDSAEEKAESEAEYGGCFK